MHLKMKLIKDAKHLILSQIHRIVIFKLNLANKQVFQKDKKSKVKAPIRRNFRFNVSMKVQIIKSKTFKIIKF